jgi:hypothetical protein
VVLRLDGSQPSEQVVWISSEQFRAGSLAKVRLRLAQKHPHPTLAHMGDQKAKAAGAGALIVMPVVPPALVVGWIHGWMALMRKRRSRALRASSGSMKTLFPILNFGT